VLQFLLFGVRLRYRSCRRFWRAPKFRLYGFYYRSGTEGEPTEKAHHDHVGLSAEGLIRGRVRRALALSSEATLLKSASRCVGRAHVDRMYSKPGA
jgi:hypothetical protein